MNKSIILWLTLLLATNVFPQTQTIDNKSSNDEQPPIATRSLPPWCGPSDNCYYLTRDYDNDGYGGFGNPRVESSQPSWPGYAPNASDCDDHNSNIHPGATEICSDGIDNNCNLSQLFHYPNFKPKRLIVSSIIK